MNQINYTIIKTSTEIEQDIKKCKDPIKKSILNSIYKLKIYNDTEEKIIKNNEYKKNINKIINEQHKNIDKLDNIKKFEVYRKILDDNKKDNNKLSLLFKRGKNEEMWNTINDPEYIKYIQEDVNNNRLMERLNSEIDFRKNSVKSKKFIKPFDKLSDNNTS